MKLGANRLGRPSPAMIIAIIALIASLSGLLGKNLAHNPVGLVGGHGRGLLPISDALYGLLSPTPYMSYGRISRRTEVRHVIYLDVDRCEL